MKKAIKIELMSDLCAGSGSGVGHFIDTDICYDDYGLPYIPSKRIKGLLREACLEYLSWSGQEHDVIDDLFGKEGSRNTGKLKIENAYLNHYEKLIEEIGKCPTKYKKYVTKNSFIQEFTSVRYQTAIEKEAGVTKENSLRSLRVLNAPEKLYAIFELEEEKYEDIIEKSVQLITHMGSNRTRGFGEVRCQVIDSPSEQENEKQKELESDKNYRIQLVLEAKSNIMISKHSTEESETYLPGSTILGAIASSYLKDYPDYDFATFQHLFLDGSICYQNAYITNWSQEKEKSLEYIPIPFSYNQVKNEKIYYNKMFDFTNAEVQLSAMGEKYVTLGNPSYIKEVELEENYHHQRAKDLSIGHVSAKEDGGILYRFAAIKKGQYFLATITGKGRYLNQILLYIQKRGTLRVGKSKSTEYGKMSIVQVEIREEVEQKKKYQKFAAILASPTILINEEEVKVAVDKNTLVKELIHTFQQPDVKITEEKAFLSYTKESGYNILWNLPKEQYSAYEKGSVIVFQSDTEIELKEEYQIGIQKQEGYGRVKIYDLEGKDERLEFSEWKEEIPTLEIEEMSKQGKKLLKSSIERKLIKQMQESAMTIIEKKKMNLNNTTIGRVLLMLKESASYDEFMENVNSMKDNKKLDKVKKVLGNVEYVRELEAYQDYFTLVSYTKEKENVFLMEYAKQIFLMLKIEGGREK